MVYFIFFAKRFFNFVITVFKVPAIFVLGLYIIFAYGVRDQLGTKLLQNLLVFRNFLRRSEFFSYSI
jgi:hypothetical protein